MSFDPSSVVLDPSLYAPTMEEVAFFKAQTGIETDEELKEHILKVQKEAWDVSSSSSAFLLQLRIKSNRWYIMSVSESLVSRSRQHN